jgi:hypothetical protein
MNRFLVIASMVAGLALAAGSGALAQTCSSKLVSMAWDCTEHCEGGFSGPNCIDFGSFGHSAHFDMADDGVWTFLVCTCEDSGSPSSSKFDASASVFRLHRKQCSLQFPREDRRQEANRTGVISRRQLVHLLMHEEIVFMPVVEPESRAISVAGYLRQRAPRAVVARLIDLVGDSSGYES